MLHADVTEKVNNKISFRINEQGEMTEQQTKAANNTSNSRFRSSGKLETVGNNLYIGYGTAEIENRSVPVKLIYK